MQKKRADLFGQPPEKYFTVYRAVSAQVADSGLSGSLRYTHYYNLAHYYSIKSKYDSSLVLLDSVYALNKNDLLVQELITATIQEKLRALPNEKAVMDFLETSFQRYPFIDKGGKLGEFYAMCLAAVTSQFFEKDKKKEGDVYLAAMKEMMVKQPEMSKKVETFFTGAVHEVYYYFIRHREYQPAKAFLVSVIKYFPDNEGVQRDMQRINEILQQHK